MAMGGARPGAGRPKGQPNKVSAKTREKAAKSGALPLEILLDIARYHFDRSLKARAKRGKTRDEGEIRAEHALAKEAADKAAPFLHSRLATTVSQVSVNGHLSLEQLIGQPVIAPANSNVPALPAPSAALDAPIAKTGETE